MLLVATRQHALLVLMHEFSHYQFSRRQGALNDLLANLLTALPLFITVQGFRGDHLRHHQHVSTSLDPNWVSSQGQARYAFPKTRRQVAHEVFKHCVGLYTWKDLKGYLVDSGMSVALPPAVQWLQWTYYLALAAVVTVLDGWGVLLLYWALPAFTFMLAILYVRDIAEHHALPHAGLLGSRTVLPHWIERLLCPNGVNFHAEHHVFPGVPSHRLARLHQARSAQPAYRQDAVVTRGYFTGLMNEAVAAERRTHSL